MNEQQHKFKQDVEQLLSDLRDACADRAAFNGVGDYDERLHYQVMAIDIDKPAEQFTLEQFPNE